MSQIAHKSPGLVFTILLTLALSLFPASPVQAAGGGVAEYVIQHGDTLTGIASRFEITLNQLLAANPQITNPNNLRAGQVIYLPPGRGEGHPKTRPPRLFFWELEKNGGRIVKTDHLYKITSGDNFYRIAARYGLTFGQLVAANPQTDPGFLTRGELIHIPIQFLGEGVYTFYETPGKVEPTSR